jgi:hypothetical protein
MNHEIKEPRFPIQSYTLKQLAVLYNVSEWVMRSWLKPIESEIGERKGHYYSPAQVRIIVAHLGVVAAMLFTVIGISMLALILSRAAVVLAARDMLPGQRLPLRKYILPFILYVTASMVMGHAVGKEIF